MWLGNVGLLPSFLLAVSVMITAFQVIESLNKLIMEERLMKNIISILFNKRVWNLGW